MPHLKLPPTFYTYIRLMLLVLLGSFSHAEGGRRILLVVFMRTRKSHAHHVVQRDLLATARRIA